MAPDGNVVFFFKKAIMGGNINIKNMVFCVFGERFLGGFGGNWEERPSKGITKH